MINCGRSNSRPPRESLAVVNLPNWGKNVARDIKKSFLFNFRTRKPERLLLLLQTKLKLLNIVFKFYSRM